MFTMTNIKNVYDEVQIFFDEELEWNSAIKREWVEGFLRQKAWQGADDENLRDLWRNLQMFVSYLAYSGDVAIDEMTAAEYSLAVEWMIVQIEEFKPNVKTVSHFFAILREFYDYLTTKKITFDTAEIEQAAQFMTGSKRLRFIESGDEETQQQTKSSLTLPKDIGRIVGEAVERLMLKFSSYFQQENFIEDFDRALVLYLGPLGQMPEDENDDEFWLEFWDYFLFDYHLLTNDRTPINQFSIDYKDRLTDEERKILHELMGAKFTVFYVESVINQDWVECVNLLTDEKFRLPNPNYDYKLIKKLLFYGHVFLQQEEHELVMINFITSVEISNNLRRRIKEEINRQKAMLELQQTGATWDDFVGRHANAVRHTIDLLATWARVNVTSYAQVERNFPQPTDDNKTVNKAVTESIAIFMPKFGYSWHDAVLAQKLWRDFSKIATVTIRKPAVWAAAVIQAYSQINNGESELPVDTLAEEMAVGKSSISANRSKIFEALKLEKYDPRYLSEEGIVSLLYDLQ
ncbi:hypothetical protein SPACI_033210 [Sporomusa acidovorans DSM 3132]|uniref:Core-binding (CB) domain-containing protein n=2 Tax=Sporomusa TaxID=2375 RepID=A0ABZ3J4S3_SPOA4|nr:hypothetical protein SPACI_42970 [Sporomusa acidovorans DSM 3132]SDE99800.1 hypothetical protein SAMN04488499_102920 [Sporomusa acidovorans]